MMTKTIAKALVLGITGLVALGGSASFAQTSNPPAASARKSGDNSQLAMNVEKALQANPVLKAADITVSAKGRNVTLEGAVFSEAEATEAVRIAQHVPGVATVANHITISATGD